MEKVNIGIRMAIKGSTQRDANQHRLPHSRPASAQGVLALLTLVFAVSSCSWMDVSTITLHFEPIDDLSEVSPGSPIYFDVGKDLNSDAFQRELDAHLGIQKWVHVTAIPQNGIFCKVLSEREPRSPMMWAWVAVSVLSLTAVPYYDGYGDRTTMSYELYIDGDLKKSYQYRITVSGLMWIGAPLVKPFLSADWVFLDTASENEAFMSTIRAFLVDAHRDGFL